MHDTNEEIQHLCIARQYAEKKLMSDEYFNTDDHKWDKMIREASKKGYLKDTKECEEILEDMLSWDKLLSGENLTKKCILLHVLPFLFSIHLY